MVTLNPLDPSSLLANFSPTFRIARSSLNPFPEKKKKPKVFDKKSLVPLHGEGERDRQVEELAKISGQRKGEKGAYRDRGEERASPSKIPLKYSRGGFRPGFRALPLVGSWPTANPRDQTRIRSICPLSCTARKTKGLYIKFTGRFVLIAA